jgi:hypothetical protein
LPTQVKLQNLFKLHFDITKIPCFFPIGDEYVDIDTNEKLENIDASS